MTKQEALVILRDHTNYTKAEVKMALDTIQKLAFEVPNP